MVVGGACVHEINNLKEKDYWCVLGYKFKKKKKEDKFYSKISEFSQNLSTFEMFNFEGIKSDNNANNND